MNKHGFRASVRHALQLFIELKLALDPRRWDSFYPSSQFKQAAFNLETSYRDLYLVGLRNKDYNVLLEDYSLLQFYGVGKPNEFRVRYAYYPNPFSIPEDGLLGDIEDIEEYMQLASESVEINRRAIIRYELAHADYRHLRHPTAHFHLGLDPESRLPVDKALTPLSFAFLVAKYLYPKEWEQQTEQFVATDVLTGLESRLIKSRAECALIDTEYFSDHERGQFFFS